MSLNQVALATNGALSMTGHCMGLVARMYAKVSNLKNVHCIVQHKGLVARDATTIVVEIQMLDFFTNKLYKWVDRITNQRNKRRLLLKDVFEEDYVVVFSR
jgi:hypothetical protein